MKLLTPALTLIWLLSHAAALAQNAPVSLAPPGPKPPAAADAKAPGRDELIARVNAYFNGLSSFSADFSQVSADGRKFEGRLYVQRPGRLRFEYKPPSEIEIIADGKSVVVRNRRLATQDLYPIGQTPLKFLLAEKIDMTRDLKLIRIAKTADMISIVVEDKTTLGGTSRISISIDDAKNVLRNWVVTDPQGFDTRVTVSGLDTARKPGPDLFKIDYTRNIDSGR